MNSNTQVATKTDIRDFIQSDNVRSQVAMVLPKHVTPERITRVMLTALMKTPNLLLCSRESLLSSLMLCSQAGLEPDGRLAHLIPYGTTCQVIFDYKGLIALALRNGYTDVFADKVCTADYFEAKFEDGQKKITHIIDWGKPRGDVYLFFASCKRDGSLDYEIMTVDEVKAIQTRSRAGKSGPWITDFDEMGKKCPLRRMSKRWDLMPEIRDVINADIDTPPPLSAPAPTVTSPKFETPMVDQRKVAALQQALEVKGDGGVEVVDEPEVLEPEPEPEPPKKRGRALATPPPKREPTVEEQVRSKCEAAGITVHQLISFMIGIGMVDNGTNSLGESQLTSPTALNTVLEQWSDIVERIKKG